MRAVAMSIFVLTLAGSAALASDDDVMRGYYGNTVISSGGSAESHTWFNADHTFTMSITAFGQMLDVRGTWEIDSNGQLCRTYQNAPPGVPSPNCIPIEAHATGDTWTVERNGARRFVNLVEGIR